MVISIIVPVYNGRNFLEKNFNSFLCQTCKDFEVIYIDDGSTDKTSDYLTEIVNAFSFVKLISSSNMGVMAARKLGLEYSSFSYITFIDVDDVIDNNFIFEMKSEIKKNEYDIIGTNFKMHRGDNVFLINRVQPNVYCSNDYLKILCSRGGWELCGKVYKKELFSNLIYPSKVTIGEDAIVFFQLVSSSKKVKIIKQNLYSYIYYNFSASNLRSLDKCKDGLFSAFFIRDFLYKKTSLDEIYLDALILLFFSNSTRRGLLKRNDLYLKKIYKSFNINAFKLIGLKKTLIVLTVFSFNYLNF